MPPRRPSLKMELDHDPATQLDALLRRLDRLEDELRAIAGILSSVVTSEDGRMCLRVERPR